MILLGLIPIRPLLGEIAAARAYGRSVTLPIIDSDGLDYTPPPRDITDYKRNIRGSDAPIFDGLAHGGPPIWNLPPVGKEGGGFTKETLIPIRRRLSASSWSDPSLAPTRTTPSL